MSDRTLMLVGLGASLVLASLAPPRGFLSLLGLVALGGAGAGVRSVPGAVPSSCFLLSAGASLRGHGPPAFRPSFGWVRGGLEGSRWGYGRGWQVWK